jgi:hypothetical protein
MSQRIYKLTGLVAILAFSVSLSRPSSVGMEGYGQTASAAAYQIENSGSERYQARNAAQHLTLAFSPQEAELKYPNGSGSLRLTGYGYGGELRHPRQATLVSAGNRLEYQRGELTEWYLNQPDGLEQGFTFARRPAGARNGEPLAIALAVSGGLNPVLAPDGNAVLFQSEGREVLRYSGLRTWDARGREIASRLEVREREIRLIVDDSSAQYPIVVDPITATTLTPAPGSPIPLLTTHPMSVVEGDFNKDSKADLAIANLGGFVSILLGNGNGTFTLSSSVANSAPRAINTGDFNGDGCPDLAVVNAPGGVTVLLNSLACNAIFVAPPPPYPTGASPEAVAVGKFQNACAAGHDDLAVTNFGDGTVSVLLNKCNATGTFNPAVSVPVGQGPDGIVVGDFNEDSKLDLAVVNSIDGTVSILLGDGAGGFTLVPSGVITLGPAGRTLNGAQVIAAGFLHSAHHLDLAISADLGVIVLLGNGDGTFGPPTSYPADQTPSSVAIGDFDGDGIQDLAVSNAFGNDVSILIGVGDGTFKPPANFPTDLFPDSVAVGTFNTNNNTNLGVAATSFSNNDVTVLLGTLWNLTAISGSGQTTEVGTTFPNPLVVQVTDATSAPVMGARVTFSAPSTGASATFSPSPPAPTDITGETQVTATANLNTGTYPVTAMLGFGATATFTLTNKADPAIAATGGTPQRTKVSTAFPNPLQARVTDNVGNGIFNVAVTFTAPATGASGTFSGPTTVHTNASGFASITFTANGTPGSYFVTASAAGIGSAFFALTNTGAPAAIVAVGGTPQNAGLGSPFPSALAARVTDAGGNAVQGATVIFAVNPVGGASGTFMGGSSTFTGATDSSGLVTASTFTANGIGGTYTVTAAVVIAGPPISTTFTLTNLAGLILPGDQTIGRNGQASFSIRMGSPAPAGDVIVTLTTGNPSIAQVIPHYIKIPAGSTTSLGMAEVIAQGVAGSTTLTASAPLYGFGPVSINVTVQ